MRGHVQKGDVLDFLKIRQMILRNFDGMKFSKVKHSFHKKDLIAK